MHVGGFPAGRSRAQGPPGGSRTFRGLQSRQLATVDGGLQRGSREGFQRDLNALRLDASANRATCILEV